MAVLMPSMWVAISDWYCDGVRLNRTASFVANSGRSAWFIGVVALMVYLTFAIALYLLPQTAG
jgi:hypothetical protein